MSTLDEIAKEKQRLGEALARVDAQREKLSSQLSELGDRACPRALHRGPAGKEDVLTQNAVHERTSCRSTTTTGAPARCNRKTG